MLFAITRCTVLHIYYHYSILECMRTTQRRGLNGVSRAFVGLLALLLLMMWGVNDVRSDGSRGR